MTPGQRRPDTVPGDLFLDPDVPAHERMTVSCGSWSAVATHVWTGSGWARLTADKPRAVPTSPTSAVAVDGAVDVRAAVQQGIPRRRSA